MVSSPDFLTILSQAAAVFPDKTQRPSVDQLKGQWQLCFATGTRKVQQGGITLKKATTSQNLPLLAKAYTK
jgi:hypothetical protein